MFVIGNIPVEYSTKLFLISTIYGLKQNDRTENQKIG